MLVSLQQTLLVGYGEESEDSRCQSQTQGCIFFGERYLIEQDCDN